MPANHVNIECVRCHKALPESASFCSRCGAARHGVTGAAGTRAWWKFRSLASVGFPLGAWPWVAAAMGGSFIVLYLDPRTAHLSFGRSSQLGAVVGASLGCLAAGLIFSYVVWRVAGQTRSAAAIGCIAGVLFLIGLNALAIRKGEQDRREQAARDELEKNERVVEGWRKMLERQGGDSYDQIGQQTQDAKPRRR